VRSFYIIATLCAVWLSVTLQADFVPGSLLILVMTLTSLGLAIMLPYFAYTFWFLEPGNIIERLRMRATLMAQRGLASASKEDVDRQQGRVLQLLEEITDIANNSIEGRDKIIAEDAVDALRDFALHYMASRSDEERTWYQMGYTLRGNAAFIGMDGELLTELESRRLWVEWKTLQQCVGVYHEALGSMQEINALVAIDTRYIGEVAAVKGYRDLVRMVLRFMNSYLRSAIEACNSRTVGDVLHQYRMLLEHLLRRGETDVACEGVTFMQYYGHIAFEEELPAVAETVAYDVATLCEYAHVHRVEGESRILRQLLDLDAEVSTESHRQRRSLRGVRRAQAKLAVCYLSAGDEGKARMIAEDMRDMTPEALSIVRDDLLQATPRHFWEIVDRGRNLHYLKDAERAQLERFLGWLRAA